MAASSEQTNELDARQRRMRFELIFASVWLAIGLFIVPAMIFWVGAVLLGPYGEGAGKGMGAFYADFFGDLATGELRTWALALGPLMLITLLRLIFMAPRRAQRSDVEASNEAEPPRMTDHRRVEPRIGE